MSEIRTVQRVCTDCGERCTCQYKILEVDGQVIRTDLHRAQCPSGCNVRDVQGWDRRMRERYPTL